MEADEDQTDSPLTAEHWLVDLSRGLQGEKPVTLYGGKFASWE